MLMNSGSNKGGHRGVAHLTKTEIAYLAGIIDGEGSISISASRQKSRRGRVYKLRVRITMVDTETMGWLAEKLGARLYRTEPRGLGRRAFYTLALEGEAAIPLIRRCLRYLITKRRQAELALEFIKVRRKLSAWRNKHRTTGGYYQPRPERYTHLLDGLVAASQRYNVRGPL